MNDQRIVTWSVLVDSLFPLLLGVGLALGFWWPLATGSGFVGGDVYNYFIPLKQFYADGLATGEIRFWHPGIGNGVPVLGDSQTGVFYPFYLLAYRFLDLNAAYNAVFLVHYVLAFAFTYWLARRLGIGRLGSTWTALVFVYGWFPPRSCLEWAIVTGAWMPLAVLACIGWLETGRRRWGWMLAAVLFVQLLAGHFQLAFITMLTVCLIAATWRLDAPSFAKALTRKSAAVAFLVAGFLLASMQLVPTWELKTRSRRAERDFVGEVESGSVPPGYFVQWIAPFSVYPMADEWLRQLGADSNKIEAHLYFGLAPLALVLLFVVSGRYERRWWPWLLLLVVGITLASGLPFAWLARVPGFGFFRWPGRYGLMAQLAVAVLTGAAADLFVRGFRRIGMPVILVLLIGNAVELYWVGHTVQYVDMVNPPIIDRIDDSQAFAQLEPTDRVFAIDGNTLALSGAACVPPYIGLNIAEYVATWKLMPDLFHGGVLSEKDHHRALRILRRTGVTHLLTEEPLSTDWPVTLVWRGYDPFLHRRWGRNPNEPLFLYRFDGGPGRAYLRDASGARLPVGTIRGIDIKAHEVTIECDATTDAELVLTDMLFPGWRVTVDGQPSTPTGDAFARVVAVSPGPHRVVWTYTPHSFHLGASISFLTLIALFGSEVARWAIRRRRQAS